MQLNAVASLKSNRIIVRAFQARPHHRTMHGRPKQKSLQNTPHKPYTFDKFIWVAFSSSIEFRPSCIGLCCPCACVGLSLRRCFTVHILSAYAEMCRFISFRYGFMAAPIHRALRERRAAQKDANRRHRQRPRLMVCSYEK